MNTCHSQPNLRERAKPYHKKSDEILKLMIYRYCPQLYRLINFCRIFKVSRFFTKHFYWETQSSNRTKLENRVIECFRPDSNWRFSRNTILD